MPDNETIKKTCEKLLDETTAFLDQLVRFKSMPGHEGPAMEWLYERFSGLADMCEKVTVPDSIVDDPDYSYTLGRLSYKGRPNIRVMLRGDGSGKSVIFNAHTDVVPPSDGHHRPFDPYIESGRMYGRGTSDDKGNVAVLWTILKAMKKLGIKPKGDVIFHIVVEEEIGGNGTLAFIRSGDRADCCINIDGGDTGKIHTSVRGAVWFTCTCYGKAGHSGMPGITVSALKLAVEAMNIIEEYHNDLLAETINDDLLFSGMANPMPVTFGRLEAGDWPAMAPQKAVLKGVFGLLTTPKEQVIREMKERIKTRGSAWLRNNFEIAFEYRHDISRIDPQLPFVQVLSRCFDSMGVKSEICAMPASSDTWFYTNLADIPAVLTGCGDGATSHTATEYVTLNAISIESAVMIAFIRDWCGLREI